MVDLPSTENLFGQKKAFKIRVLDLHVYNLAFNLWPWGALSHNSKQSVNLPTV